MPSVAERILNPHAPADGPPPRRGPLHRRTGLTGAMVGMVVLTTAANVINYTSSLVFSRTLEPVGFGELTSLLALSLMLAVPLGAAQTVVAQRVAVGHAAGKPESIGWLLRHALGHVATLGAVVGVLYIACIPLVISVLNIRQPGPAIALAPLVVLSFINPVTFGVLQGLERFTALGVVVFAVAASRLIFGLPWALAGGGAGGAIAGQALGLLAVHVITLWSLRKLFIGRGTGAATSGMRRRIDLTALSASGAFIGFAILSNLDLVLARLYLNNHDAGIYAAIATVAKIVIFLPSAVAVIMVPNAARAKVLEGDSSRVLKISGALVAGAALICAIPALVAPGLIVDVMFGSNYRAAEAGMVPAVVAGAALALLNLLCNYVVAIRDRRWLWLLFAGVVLQVGAIALFHDSPAQIAWAQACVALTLLVLNELLLHSIVPRRTRPA